MLAKKHKPYGLNENKKIAKEVGKMASNTRRDIESKLGASVISKENSLDHKYEDNIKIGD